MRREITTGWLSCAAAVLLAAALATPARAVVLSVARDTPNLLEPGSNPLWENMGRVGNASGIYLGNRWVITANHVGGSSLRLSDGRELAASVGSGEQLQNPSGTRPDLRLFRLAEDPGLEAAEIAASAPGVGTRVMMIGAGGDKSPRLQGWQTTIPQWIEVSLRSANAVGFDLLGSSAMRWGLNQVSGASVLGADQTQAFSTRFDLGGVAFEAQAVSGDSGGGVFHLVDGAWQLDGIMYSAQFLPGQPSGAVVYGDLTFIADLSAYRSQIVEILDREEPLWQNQVNHFDVDGSGRVEGRDLLILTNELLAGDARDLEGAPTAADRLFDVNGDLRLSEQDTQALIDALMGGTANPASAASFSAPGMTLIPEPSTAVLAIGGFLLFALGRAVRRRRGRQTRM